MFSQDYIGNTPFATLRRLGAGVRNRFSVKLEGNNPAGSVKDRQVYSMIKHAEAHADTERYNPELAAHEGIFCGISSGGPICASLRLAQELSDAHIVTVTCDRDDRYLTTGFFPQN
ncbi:MAG: pyridoxal-phosphate dependent enzyme [Gammaproteobacteria bacterium]|nr:pyridoxal-phosphate dependent enzyme [Gammaproteobacteria bacterium]